MPWTTAGQGIYANADHGWYWGTGWPIPLPPDYTADLGGATFELAESTTHVFIDIIVVWRDRATGAPLVQVHNSNIETWNGIGAEISTYGGDHDIASVVFQDHADPTLIYASWTHETYIPPPEVLPNVAAARPVVHFNSTFEPASP
jgi:hypothetical protein